MLRAKSKPLVAADVGKTTKKLDAPSAMCARALFPTVGLVSAIQEDRVAEHMAEHHGAPKRSPQLRCFNTAMAAATLPTFVLLAGAAKVQKTLAGQNLNCNR